MWRSRIDTRAIAYYMFSTFLALILGIILVTSIQPGTGYGRDRRKKAAQVEEIRPSLTEDTLMDLLRHIFPPNLVEAAIITHSTVLIPPGDLNGTEDTTDSEKKEWDFETVRENHSNILGLVMFSVVLGITLAKMETQGKPLLDFFIALSDAMMIITKMVIWLTPIGILFLVASKIMEIEDLGKLVGSIGMYTVTVFFGVMVHGFIVLPLIYFALVRKIPFRFIINMGQALATAFGTSSSSATLPVTITCLEEKNFVDPRIARFCLPIGATINMDGTALYEAVAAIFIAQVRGVSLGIGEIIAISITATAASIGAAGIPQAGLVTMVMVLNVIGLPAEDITLILIVDWILDRFRTLVNVLGDAFGTAIVDHYSKSDLPELIDE